ncbi:GAF domain-containing protein [Mariniplasma anaerobium]|uniref:GAF domain-containing protein n=1 Tax=Mariniplasma anaerobium TaxID=2735436 RepID=A0A7U9XUW0_9MOLU|nr:GAF domain-containing protein [Mariniplasma anaerobium]BCR36563.1 GAF domain-containing protein [Mariniplasma anaerobium]
MKIEELLISAKALLETQPNQIALLSNASAFIFDSFENLNWAGFYLLNKDILTVGPFQGHVACSTIPLGNGVCGQAAQFRKTIVVDDVLSYDNHIACDSNSRSEVVIPIIINDKVFGVLDVDSPIYNRFDKTIVEFLESFVKLLTKLIDF